MNASQLPKRGPEAEKSHYARTLAQAGFYQKYMQGQGLDIGYRGDSGEPTIPVLPSAEGIDKDYPGYKGVVLPFPSKSQDYVFASHVLEHIKDYVGAIASWFDVLKVGGHLIICVPHQELYERKASLPSRWNQDHKRYYTPRTLLLEILQAVPEGSYRVAHLRDNDDGYDYSIPEDKHPGGCYEIECVIRRIK